MEISSSLDIRIHQSSLSSSPHSGNDDDMDYGSKQYTMITSKHEVRHKVLEFNHRKSVALCIGIDKQCDRRFLNSLGGTVAKDTEEVGKAFITNFGLDVAQVEVCTSSTQPHRCTKKGIENLFIKTARRAETNGLFIFFFAGHGFMVRNKCVLAPSDFAGTGIPCSGFSGIDLIKWLQASQCKASYIIFIFDCCHAGSLGADLTAPGNILKIPGAPGIFSMCACSALEECTAISALGHSIFSYFFLSYLERQKFEGEFAITQAMKEIRELCVNFSSLIVTYNDELRGLFDNKMQPTLEALVFDACSGMDKTDSGGRFELLFSLYDKSVKSRPHVQVDRWLTSSAVQISLLTLSSKASFTKTLQEGVMCAMLYSVASIQLKHDSAPLTERNFFITMTVSVLGAIGYAYPEISISIYQLIKGLKHYRQPLSRANIDVHLLDTLLTELNNMSSAPGPVFNKSSPYINREDIYDNED